MANLSKILPSFSKITSLKSGFLKNKYLVAKLGLNKHYPYLKALYSILLVSQEIPNNSLAEFMKI